MKWVLKLIKESNGIIKKLSHPNKGKKRIAKEEQQQSKQKKPDGTNRRQIAIW